MCGIANPTMVVRRLRMCSLVGRFLLSASIVLHPRLLVPCRTISSANKPIRWTGPHHCSQLDRVMRIAGSAGSTAPASPAVAGIREMPIANKDPCSIHGAISRFKWVILCIVTAKPPAREPAPAKQRWYAGASITLQSPWYQTAYFMGSTCDENHTTNGSYAQSLLILFPTSPCSRACVSAKSWGMGRFWGHRGRQSPQSVQKFPCEPGNQCPAPPALTPFSSL